MPSCQLTRATRGACHSAQKDPHNPQNDRNVPPLTKSPGLCRWMDVPPSQAPPTKRALLSASIQASSRNRKPLQAPDRAGAATDLPWIRSPPPQPRGKKQTSIIRGPVHISHAKDRASGMHVPGATWRGNNRKMATVQAKRKEPKRSASDLWGEDLCSSGRTRPAPEPNLLENLCIIHVVQKSSYKVFAQA